ncbi:hypothetical protein [Kaarinaea lacus]
MIKRVACFITSLLFTTAAYTASIEGKWCQDGESYICYPPVQYDSDVYTCTDSTSIHNASAESLEWVINQTHHYYVDGITNGNSQSKQVILKFKRSPDPLQHVYESKIHTNDTTQMRRLVVKEDSLFFEMTQIPDNSDAAQLKERTTYTRCSGDKNIHRFYTALVDCGGSGDYIAGVPAVVDNPLLWSQWKSFSKNTHCRIAARCWGGGWVAFAYSKDERDDNTAFGAACGGESRHDAKQQAINTCKQSGGDNCLYQVLSAFDNGVSEGIDATNKGSKLESCYYGNCEQLRD